MDPLLAVLLPLSIGAVFAFHFHFKALRNRSSEGRDNAFATVFWGLFAPLRYFTHVGNRYRVYSALCVLVGVAASRLVRQLVFH
jgi:hypothetical protein